MWTPAGNEAGSRHDGANDGRPSSLATSSDSARTDILWLSVLRGDVTEGDCRRRWSSPGEMVVGSSVSGKSSSR